MNNVYQLKPLRLVALVVAIIITTWANAQTNYFSRPTATNFADPASWSTSTNGIGGTSPVSITNADNYTIQNGSVMVLDANASVRQLTINSGSLSVSANTLTVARATTNLALLTINSGGTLNVNGGAINVNGAFDVAAGGTFIQSNGTITVDGNDAGIVANSITAQPIVRFQSTALTLSGGTFICVDPSANTTATLTVQYNFTTTSVNATGTHTFQFGNGLSTDAGGNATNQFRVDWYTGTGRLNPMNVVINLPAGTNRTVTQAFTQGCNGNLTITNGELLMSSGYFVGGSITNNGTLTTQANTLTLGTAVGTTSAATTNLQTIGGTGIFRNATAGPTANFNSLTINNTNSGTGVTFANANSLLSNASYGGTVSNTLTLTSGNISTGSNRFILGVSTGTAGTLSYTSGGFGDGSTFGRWIATAGAGTTISANTAPTNGALSYPFFAESSNRFFHINRPVTTGSTGGVIAVTYNNGGGGLATITTVSDGGYNINRRTNANWTVSYPTINSTTFAPGTGTFVIAASGSGIFIPTVATGPRMMYASSVVGTNQGGTIAPIAQRGTTATGLTSAQLIGGAWYMGVASTDLSLTSVTTGPWESGSTWSTGVAPTATDNPIILAGHNVTVNAAAATCSTATVSVGGTLTVSGNTLNVVGGAGTGITNNGTVVVSGGTLNVGNVANTQNRLFNNAVATSTLTVSSGTMNVNGTLTIAGGTFNHTGGNINLDNNGSLASATTPAANFTGGTTYNLTGGTITIVDPNATSGNNAFAYSATPITIASGTHTVVFGDGISNTAGPSTSTGFILSNTGARFNFNNLTINGGNTGANRFVVQAANSTSIVGTMTINANSEYRTNTYSLYLAGNLVNNGLFIADGTSGDALRFQDYRTGSAVAVTVAQSVTGTGTIQNLATAATANMSALIIQNTSATGVSFANTGNFVKGVGTGTVSGTFTLTAGRINTNGDIFTIGISAATPATLAYTAGGFVGGSTVRRWFGTASLTVGGVAGQFPFVSAANNNRSAFIGNSGAITTGGTVSATYTDAAGVATVTPFTDLGTSIERVSNANWAFATGGGISLGAQTLSARLQADGINTVTNFAAIRITGATASAPGTSVAGTGSNANPQANKTTMSLTDIANTFRVGFPNVIQSIATGNWSATSTWDCACVPTATDNVQINNTHNVTVDATYSVTNAGVVAGGTLTVPAAGNLTVTGGLTLIGTYVNNGGTLSVPNAGLTIPTGAVATHNSGTLNIGTNGTNISVLSATAGTLTVAGGTLNIFGGLSVSGGTFNHSNGTINVDGNGSVSSMTTSIVNLTSGTFNFTGGTLNIIDPAATTGVNAFAYSATGNISASGTHTVVFGDGVSTTAGSTDGFLLSNTGARFNFNNLTINGGNAGTNRFVAQNGNSNSVLSTITINANSEYRCSLWSLHLAGNMVNNGVFVSNGSGTDGLRLQNFSTGTGVAVTVSQSITGTGTIQNAITSPTANFTTLVINNTNATGVTFANTGNFIKGVGTGTVSTSLTLTAGLVNIGSDIFTIGISTTTPASLNYTAGGFVSGTVRRWFGTSSITTGNSLGQYPFVEGANNRSAFIGTSGAITGGTLDVTFAPVAGFTTVTAINDLGVDIIRTSNSTWQVAAGSLNLGSSTANLRINGQGVLPTTDFASTRIVLGANTIAPGTSVAGTGTSTAPQGNKTLMTAANLTNTFKIGFTSLIQSIATGNWGATTTWDCACVPTASDNVQINAGHNVTVETSYTVASVTVVGTPSVGTLTIPASGSLTATGTFTLNGTYVNNGGTLTVANSSITASSTTTITHNSGTLNIGTNGTNTRLLDLTGGTLTVAGGTVNIFGRAAFTSGTFNQSGGDINIDGNANISANSVPAGNRMLTVNSNVAGIVSGGRITIVDPHFDLPSTQTFGFVGIAGLDRIWTGHTLRLGDGASTDASSATRGFEVDCFAGDNTLTLGTLEVNGGSGTNRITTTANSTINGTFAINLLINANSELRNTTNTFFYILGNINNNGILSILNTLWLDNLDGSAITTAQTVGGNGIYRNLVTSPTANFTNLSINNSNTTGVTFSSNAITGVGTGSVSGTFTLTAGRLNIGSNIFTLGISIGTPGTFSYTAGGFTSGTVRRWYGTATVTLPSPLGQFPFVEGANSRVAQIGTSGAITGGFADVTFTPVAGLTTITSVNDAGSDITRTSNSTWQVAAGSLNLGSATANLRLSGQGLLPTVDPTTTRIFLASNTVAPGTSVLGTGSNLAPQGNKTTLSTTDLANTFKLAFPTQVISVATGNWGDASTWDCVCIPTSTDNVFIDPAHNVTLNVNGNAASVTINATGTLTANANTLAVVNNFQNSGTLLLGGATINIGPAGGGNKFYATSTGSTTTISSGNLNVNGNFNMIGTFNQSGGDIKVDGNSGVAGTSVAATVRLFDIGACPAITITGGSWTIVDPNFFGSAAASLRYNRSLGNLNLPVAHTINWGDGVSNTAGGSATDGFWHDTYFGSNRMHFGTMVVNGPAGANRFVTANWSVGIAGNLTVNPGGELLIDNSNTHHVNGNIINNGTITTVASTLSLQSFTGISTIAPSTNNQQVSGSGVFRDSQTAPTASFSNLTINNTNVNGVDLNVNNLTLSGTLTFTAGQIDLNGNTFSIGASATVLGSLGTVGTGAGFTAGTGTVTRWFGTAATSISTAANSRYPFVVGSIDRSAYFGTSGAITGGSVSVQHTDGVGVNNITPFIDNGVDIAKTSNAFWTVSNSINLGLSSGQLRFQADGITTVNAVADIRATLASAVAPGNSANGTGTPTNPQANKDGMAAGDITGTFRLGVPSQITSIANGFWGDVGTWDCACIPTASDNVTINHTVTLGTSTGNPSPYAGAGVTIGAAGQLLAPNFVLNTARAITNNGAIDISGGTINQGPTGGGTASYLQTATGTTYTISAGTHNVNGAFQISSGAFNQSGGDINVDGNGNSLANSIGITTSIVSIGTAVTGTVNGGRMTIVDPHFGNVTGSFPTFSFNTGGTNRSWLGHTLRLGNGTSTDASASLKGFEVDCYVNTGILTLGTLEINGGSGINRFGNITTAVGNGIMTTNLQINNGSTLTSTNGSTNRLVVSGNITNNGTFTANGCILYLASGSGTNATTLPQTIGGTGVYRNLATSPTANFSNITINNTNPAGVTFTPSSITGVGSGTVSGTLALNAGIVNLSGSTFTLGINTPAVGTLIVTAGAGFVAGSGTFRRWFDGTAVTMGNVAGQFPFIAGTNDRSAYFGTSGAITGGSVSVSHTDGVGVNNVTAFTDNGVQVAKTSNAFWTLSNTINLGASTGLMRFQGNGITTLTNLADLRATLATAVAPGNSIAGTGTLSAPQANKDGMTAANISGAFHFGLPNNITSIAAGLWGDVGTWDCTCIPTTTDNVTVNHAVTLGTSSGNPSPYNAAAVTIGSAGQVLAPNFVLNVNRAITNSGTVNISGGTINQGPAGGGNASYIQSTSGASYTISSGTHNVNGAFQSSAGSVTQTGGTIVIDGNSGTASTSTASGVHLFSISGGTPSFTAGSITIVDPPHSSIAAGTTRAISVSLGASSTVFDGTHVVNFGDGSSTTVGNTDGFIVDTDVSSVVTLNNVIVNAGSATGRWVSPSYNTGAVGMYVKGTLTINNGSEVRHQFASNFAVAGNIVNNGTLTTAATTALSLGNISTTPTVTAAAQTLSGSGVYRNLSVSPTANFGNLTINNANGVTLPANATTGVGTGSVSGTLTMTQGIITLGGNFTVGISAAAPGTLSYTAGYFMGASVTRWLNTTAISLGTAAGRFPFGTGGTNDRSFFVGVNGTLASGGTMTVTYNDVVGTTPLVFNDAGATSSSRSNANWVVSQSGLNAGTGSLSTRLAGDGLPVSAFAGSRIALVGGIAPGTSGAGTGSNAAPRANKNTVSVAGAVGTFYFAIGAVTCPAPTTLAAGTITANTASLNWTAGGSETSWDIECILNSASPTGTPTATGVTNPYVVTGLSAGTTYQYFVRASCGGGNTSGWVGPFTFTTLFNAPANDLICGAIQLSINPLAVWTTYNNIGATTTGSPAAPTCQANYVRDVWYTLVVPPSGHLAIYTRAAATPPVMDDPILDVFTSSNNTCTGTLTPIACNDDGGPSTYSFVYLNGLTPGNRLFFRFSSWGSASVTQGNFDVALTEAKQWTGASTATWSTGSNWLFDDAASLPTTNQHVIIPATANNPVVTLSTSCGNLQVLSSASVSVNANNTLTLSGNIIGSSSGSLFGGAGTYVMAGTGAQTISGNGNVISGLRINNAAGVTVTSGNTQTITRALELQNGTLTSNNTITMRSILNSSAYIDNFTPGYTGTMTGNVTFQRFSGGTTGFRYLAMPINNPAITEISEVGLSGPNNGQIVPLPTCSNGAIASNSPYGNVMEWRENGPFTIPACRQQGWYVRSAGSLETGRGYLVRMVQNSTINVTGTPNLNAVTYATPLDLSNPTGNGWHLMGNPYAAPYRWDSDITGFGDLNRFNATGAFVGTFTPVVVASPAADRTLPIFGGFFIRRQGSGALSFGLPATNRRADATINYSSEDEYTNLHVQINGNGFGDESRIYFIDNDPTATSGYETKYDARKIEGNDDQPLIYTHLLDGTEQLGINGFGKLDQQYVIPMVMKPGQNGAFSLNFNNIDMFDPSVMIYLEDKQTNELISLRNNPEYTFSSNVNDNPERFNIRFEPGVKATIADQTCDDMGSITLTQEGGTVWSNFTVVDNNNTLYAQGTNFNGTVTVNNLPAQEYIVNLTHPSGYVAQEFYTINGNSPVDVTLNTNTIYYNVAETVNLTAVLGNNSANVNNYVWNFGDGTSITAGPVVTHSYNTPGEYNVSVTANSATCQDVATKTIFVAQPTSVNNADANGLNVFANGNVLSVEFNKWGNADATVNVVNLLGQEITKFTNVSTANGRKDLNVGEVVPGMYLVIISSGDKSFTRKVYIGSNK